MGFCLPPLAAPARTGRPRANGRRTIEGILYVLITGCRWRDMPRKYGAPTTVKWQRKCGRPVVARKDDYRRRYKVERRFAWLGSFRRLLLRWERLFVVYRSLFTCALMLLSARRIEHKGSSEEWSQRDQQNRC